MAKQMTYLDLLALRTDLYELLQQLSRKQDLVFLETKDHTLIDEANVANAATYDYWLNQKNLERVRLRIKDLQQAEALVAQQLAYYQQYDFTHARSEVAYYQDDLQADRRHYSSQSDRDALAMYAIDDLISHAKTQKYQFQTQIEQEKKNEQKFQAGVVKATAELRTAGIKVEDLVDPTK